MMERAFLNNNQENDSENRINITRFYYILVYIFFVIDKIIRLLKIKILRRRLKREKKNDNILLRVVQANNFICYDNDCLKIRNKTKMNMIIIKNRNIHNDYDKENNSYQKKIKHFNNSSKKIIINYIIIIFIKIIIINIFGQINNNKIFDLFYFQDSKITLKIKGIGYHSLFGNEIKGNFSGINFLKSVKINGIMKNKIAYKYDFNEKDNTVELILDDNLKDCGFMFWNCSEIEEIDLSKFDTSQVIFMNGMFGYCSSLTSLNLFNFKTSKVLYMNWMFAYCSKLTFLDLSNFDTSKVKDMNDLFAYCSSLISINLSNFDTSQVTNMVNMFYNCSAITSLNLSNFNIFNVNVMHYMFAYCSSLISLNLSNFDTSQVTNMVKMFYNCSAITSLNLSNLNIFNVTVMYNMFAYCSSLISINLSNFDTIHVTDMESMFYNCVNLEYINLINFNESRLYDDQIYFKNMFYNVPENVVVCINENITKNKIFPQIKNKAYYVIDCTDNWKSKQKGVINVLNIIIMICQKKMK